jgi:SAM-dependent methyltransferase
LRMAVRNSRLGVQVRRMPQLLQLGTYVQRLFLPHSTACPDVVPPSTDRVQFPLGSSICTQAFIESPIYAEWCTRFKQLPVYHRKQWEFVYICQALSERGMLARGRRGLGFGVGREPLGSLFAKLGCKLVLTDMEQDKALQHGWTDTNQHASALRQLIYKNICDEETFLRAAEFESVDMNRIPAHLSGFDFCWSSCALEHLGSIEHGLTFIKNSLDCLKPGGIAVHTTEFNVGSNRSTLDHASTVLFRECDLIRLRDSLRAIGHNMQPLNLDRGTAVLDGYIDMPPFRSDKHLKLALSRFVTTSVGVIVEKGPR